MRKISGSLALLVVVFGLLPLSYAMEGINPVPVPLPVPGQIPFSSKGDAISAEDAAKFIGQEKTVNGKVASAHYAAIVNGKPTFLYLDKSFPNQVLTILVWGSDRSKFEKPPEIFYTGKEIYVTGMIQSYQGRPEIIVKDPAQIKMK